MSMLLALIYLAALTIVLALQQWVGQLHPITGSMLYLPPQLWIAPALVLAPLFLLRRSTRRAGIVLAVVSGWYFLFCLSPQAHRSLPPEPNDLTVVSWNAGLASPEILKPFVARHSPDVILLQEVNGRHGRFARTFPDYKGRAVDEFLILSRLPIKTAGVVELQTMYRGLPCAGRFVIDYHGTSIAIYNVHLPTLRALLKPGLAKSRQAANEWKRRVTMADELAEVLKNEPLPVLAIGDFNTPDRGPVYRRVALGMQDAHRERGRGYGFTLPGYKKGRKAIIGPWLRLDHAFADPSWEVCNSSVLPAANAQHRAISASLRLKESHAEARRRGEGK